jgi:Holliday junction resolvase RusA-like endonuclease
MIELPMKPLSVNQCWQGKRFKTPKYKAYELEMILRLPSLNINTNVPLSIDMTFGFSNSLCDVDNPVKPVLDILQKKYMINDKNIVALNLSKEIVKKGNEFIKIKITEK